MPAIRPILTLEEQILRARTKRVSRRRWSIPNGAARFATGAAALSTVKGSHSTPRTSPFGPTTIAPSPLTSGVIGRTDFQVTPSSL